MVVPPFSQNSAFVMQINSGPSVLIELLCFKLSHLFQQKKNSPFDREMLIWQRSKKIYHVSTGVSTGSKKELKVLI